jgi:hypothetical protein
MRMTSLEFLAHLNQEKNRTEIYEILASVIRLLPSGRGESPSHEQLVEKLSAMSDEKLFHFAKHYQILRDVEENV